MAGVPRACAPRERRERLALGSLVFGMSGLGLWVW